MLEVLVASVQRQVVLQNKRCEPHIVRRNRCALLPELMKHCGVMVGRLIVGKQDVYTILQEELPQCSLVVGLPATVNESGAKFPEHHKRQQDGFGFFEQRHRLIDSPAEIDISVGVERYPHRQRSAST